MTKNNPTLHIVKTSEKVVFCDGTDPKNPDNDMGHPGVYLKIAETFVECTYCGKRFVYEDSQN